jgi:predicted alpha-1,6-mannanase (GH76 family)
MERYFFVPANRSYDGTYPIIGEGHAQLWPYSQALLATLALARLSGGGEAARANLPAIIARLSAYRAHVRRFLAYAPVYGGRGNAFYDDNVWVGLALVAAADLNGDRSELTSAQQVLDWIQTGWDTAGRRCRGGVYWLMPGGKYWKRSPGSRYRTAVSTLNAALLGVMLYERTSTRSDLLWAERAYAWSTRCLGTGNGLIADHIDADGNVTGDIHSYNQGAAIATAANLYRATDDRRYLADALRTTAAALQAFHDPLTGGDGAPFLAIFFGDLAQVIPLAHGGAIRQAIASFADRAWADERDPKTGLFHFGHTQATLLDQAAMVQVYAELASM